MRLPLATRAGVTPDIQAAGLKLATRTQRMAAACLGQPLTMAMIAAAPLATDTAAKHPIVRETLKATVKHTAAIASEVL